MSLFGRMVRHSKGHSKGGNDYSKTNCPRLMPLTQRFWRKVERSDGCWLWTGVRTGRGYGRIQQGGLEKRKALLVHRLSWELHFGAIPAGLVVCHKCDVPLCVRPDHLFLGTQRDNIADCIAKGRSVRCNPVRTHCRKGHEFTPENTLLLRGGRGCLTCRRLGNRAYKRRLREKCRAA